MAASRNPKALRELIYEINDKGWQVSTLNQLQDGKWLSSVRKPGYFPSGFGQADDSLIALQRAWDSRKEPIEDRIPTRAPSWPPSNLRTDRVRLVKK